MKFSEKFVAGGRWTRSILIKEVGITKHDPCVPAMSFDSAVRSQLGLGSLTVSNKSLEQVIR